MKIFVSEIFVAVIVTIVVQSNASKLLVQNNDMDMQVLETQQVKREVMAGSGAGNPQNDGKSLNGPLPMGMNMGNMQAFARYPNYATGFGGAPFTGSPGLLINAGGLGGAGYPGSVYPYEMNYEMQPQFAGGSFQYGGAYPGQYPVGGVTPQFGFSQLQNYPGQQISGQQIPLQQQIPGQYSIQSQLAQQQLQAQQQQFLMQQPHSQQQQQLGGYQVLPSINSQFGYSPALRGYQFSMGNAM